MTRDKCKNWKKYKGIRKPTCGCTFCNTFYTMKQDFKEFEGKELNKETKEKIKEKIEATLFTLLLK